MDSTKIRVYSRKAFNTLRFFIISSIVLTLLEIGIGYWLLSSRWQLFITDNEMKGFAREVAEFKPMPSNFLRVYSAIFPKHINGTMSEMIFFNYAYRLVFRDPDYDSKPHCFCDLVYDVQILHNTKLKNIAWGGRLKDLEYGFGLEKYTTPEKCFTYFMQEETRALKRRLDSERFPAIVHKRIEDMTDDEVIELILLLKSMENFNRHNNPESFLEKFAEYKIKVERANKR